VVFDAEHYETKSDGSGPAAGWAWTQMGGDGSLGEGYLQALPDSGLAIDAPQIEPHSPHLQYHVRFDTVGTFYLWLRGSGQIDDTVHFGIDGTSISTDHDTAALCDWDVFYWWSELGQWDARPVVEVPSQGVHTVDIWMRDDGAALDRVLLTVDQGYSPPHDGPPESPIDLPQFGDLDQDNDCDAADFAIFAGNFTGPLE